MRKINLEIPFLDLVDLETISIMSTTNKILVLIVVAIATIFLCDFSLELISNPSTFENVAGILLFVITWNSVNRIINFIFNRK